MALKLDPYVLDVLMPDLVGHDRHPSALVVYLYLFRQSGTRLKSVQRSLQEISDGTGLSRRSVQNAIARLQNRKLLSVARESITAVPEYQLMAPWRR